PLHRERPRGDGRRPDTTARRGRGGRGADAERVPHGHLSRLRGAAPLRPGARPAHRRGPRRGGRPHPDLCVGRRGPRRDRDLKGSAPMPAVPELTPEELEEFGRELDRIRTEVMTSLGEEDARYIRGLVATRRGLEVAGRALLFASW